MEKNQGRKEKEKKNKKEKESLTKTYNIRGNTMENLFLPVTGIGTGLKDAQPWSQPWVTGSAHKGEH